MIDLKEHGIPYSYIPIIAGPTASGKSDLAINVALKVKGEIISCDSMQIYKSLDIGTAKVTPEEQQIVKHHMIDIIEPTQNYSVNDFVHEASRIMNELISEGILPVLCGGTGQYISTFCEGLKYVDQKIDKSVLDEINREVETVGIDRIYDELCKIDPIAAEKIHKNNTRRVIRAYAVYKGTGKTFTWWNQNSRNEGPKFPFKLFCLERDRALLYDRINLRVDKMLDAGLEEEVKRLHESHVLDGVTARQAIGYKELLDYYEGKCTREEAIYNIKLRSRHYAKRQLTWFRYMDYKIDIDPDDPKSLDLILETIR